MSLRVAPSPRSHYPRFSNIQTRWADNDVYGHVNNVVYYSYFDTVINRWLIEAGALNIEGGSVIGLVVQTQCHYFVPVAFPQSLEAGLRVAHLGRSSVRYEIGLFVPGHPTSAAAGHIVHVYVDRASRRPLSLPAAVRAALQPLQTLE